MDHIIKSHSIESPQPPVQTFFQKMIAVQAQALSLEETVNDLHLHLFGPTPENTIQGSKDFVDEPHMLRRMETILLTISRSMNEAENLCMRLDKEFRS